MADDPQNPDPQEPPMPYDLVNKEDLIQMPSTTYFCRYNSDTQVLSGFYAIVGPNDGVTEHRVRRYMAGFFAYYPTLSAPGQWVPPFWSPYEDDLTDPTRNDRLSDELSSLDQPVYAVFKAGFTDGIRVKSPWAWETDDQFPDGHWVRMQFGDWPVDIPPQD